jgi:hypothetical protein
VAHKKESKMKKAGREKPSGFIKVTVKTPDVFAGS